MFTLCNMVSDQETTNEVDFVHLFSCSHRAAKLLSRPDVGMGPLTRMFNVSFPVIVDSAHIETVKTNLIPRPRSEISEFAICHVVRHGNVNSIRNPSTVTNSTMEPFCILLPLTLPCRTTGQITNSLLVSLRFVTLYATAT